MPIASLGYMSKIKYYGKELMHNAAR